MLKIIVFALSLTLTACATSVTPASNTSQASTVLAPSMMRASPGTFAVTFKRDSGWMGAACSARVYVAGTPIAELRAGQAVVVYLAPGEYVVGAQITGICGGGDAEASMRVVEGRASAFRIGAGQDGTLRISPTAF